MFQGFIRITNYSNQSLFRTLGMYCVETKIRAHFRGGVDLFVFQ